MDENKEYEAACLKLYCDNREEVAVRMKSHHEKWPVAVGKVVGPGRVKMYRHGQDLYKVTVKPVLPSPATPVIKKESGQQFFKF